MGRRTIGTRWIDVPVEVEVDSHRISQVFVNPINNAIKYKHVGGDVWLTATADQTHFVCDLKDKGKGIPPDMQPKIFDVSTRAEHGDARRGAGLGIGLPVVKELVPPHQGTVEVRSGSQFIVRAPLRKPS